jgi:hypothetical protein
MSLTLGCMCVVLHYVIGIVIRGCQPPLPMKQLHASTAVCVVCVVIVVVLVGCSWLSLLSVLWLPL